MHKVLTNNKILPLWQGKVKRSVLLISSGADDAYCYQAPIVKQLSARELVLSFHADSLLAERVLLFSPLEVSINMLPEGPFVGELCPWSSEGDSAPRQGRVLLKLKICQRASSEVLDESPLSPRT